MPVSKNRRKHFMKEAAELAIVGESAFGIRHSFHSGVVKGKFRSTHCHTRCSSRSAWSSAHSASSATAFIHLAAECLNQKKFPAIRSTVDPTVSVAVPTSILLRPHATKYHRKVATTF